VKLENFFSFFENFVPKNSAKLYAKNAKRMRKPQIFGNLPI